MIKEVMKESRDEFIGHLYLLASDNPDAKDGQVELRRGFKARMPWECDDMRFHIHVIKYTPGLTHEQRKPFYMVASLFSLKPVMNDDKQDMGKTVASISKMSRSMRDRFMALLSARGDESLYRGLRNIIGFLISSGARIDWKTLLYHLSQWDNPDRWVQRTWAESFAKYGGI